MWRWGTASPPFFSVVDDEAEAGGGGVVQTEVAGDVSGD